MSLENLTNVTDSNTLEQVVEFDKRYKHTYLQIKFPHLEEVQIWYFEGMIEDNKKLMFSSKEEGNVELLPKTQCTIIADFPTTGLFNHNNSFYGFYRVPDRQWKRGICNRNAVIRNSFSCLGAFGSVNIEFDSLNSVFNSYYPDTLLDGANILGINKDMAAIAVSKDIGLSKSFTSDASKYVLWWHSKPFALLDRRSKVIEVYHKPLSQELHDFLCEKGERELWQLI